MIATDASMLGGGVVYKWMSYQDVSHLVSSRVYSSAYSTLDSTVIKVERPRINLKDKWLPARAIEWMYTDHINILEGQAILAACRWIAKFPKDHNSRIVFLCDSQVMVGALSKGRSSSRRVLHLCRKISAWLLALNIRPYWIWVPTDLNPADAISRLPYD